MKIKSYYARVEALRKKKERLIHVSNAEWYTLFKDEIRNSIAIEGVFTNRQELIDVLEKNKRTNKQKAAAILGYYEAASNMYDYAVNQREEEEFQLRMADIKQIHTILMRYEKELGTYGGEIGEFRKENVAVTQSTFQPVDYNYIRESMQLMIQWFNTQIRKTRYDSIMMAAITHTWFETIHPFRDGNGRVGRILLSYILVGSDLVNISIKGFTKTDRDRYYNALEKADDSIEKMLRQIEKGKKVAAKDVDSFMIEKDFSGITEMITSQLEHALSNLEKIKTLNLNPEALLPLRDVAVAYDYSQDYLRNLINRKELKASKKGKLWYVRIADMASYLSKLEK